MRQARGQYVNMAGLRAFGRVLRTPSLALPHHAVRTLDELDWAALRARHGVRAVVFDKDNTLTLPYASELHPSVADALARCRREFSPSHVALFSNTAGSPDDADHAHARHLEAALGMHVLRHAQRKPGGGADVAAHFAHCDARAIAVVGDRYLTDVVLANLNGFRAIHVEPLDARLDNGVVRAARAAETWLVRHWRARGHTAPPLQ